jgi:hypothetical protein
MSSLPDSLVALSTVTLKWGGSITVYEDGSIRLPSGMLVKEWNSGTVSRFVPGGESGVWQDLTDQEQSDEAPSSPSTEDSDMDMVDAPLKDSELKLFTYCNLESYVDFLISEKGPTKWGLQGADKNETLQRLQDDPEQFAVQKVLTQYERWARGNNECEGKICRVCFMEYKLMFVRNHKKSTPTCHCTKTYRNIGKL